MRIYLEPFTNPNAVGKQILKTTRVYPNTLEYVVIRLGGGVAPTKAQLTRIVVKLGSSSKPIWDITGAQLNTLNLYEGRPNTATVLILPFSNPRARTVESQMIPALDLGQVGVREFIVEIDVGGGTTPFLDAWAEVAPPKLFGVDKNGQPAAENLLFRALLRTPINIPSATTRTPINPATAAAGGALLRRLQMFDGTITAFELKRDGQAYFEETPLAVNNAVLDELGHDPQANLYTFDAIDDDNESKALAQVRNDQGGLSLIPQQFIVTASAPIASFDAVADLVANVNGL